MGNRKEQRVVRTYPINYYEGGDYYSMKVLQDSLDYGWQVIMANPIACAGEECQGIEYILERDI
jgi:hypothetical protein